MSSFLFLLLALSVSKDQAPMRAGCDEGTTVLTRLPAGTALKLRYVLAGEKRPCYKVSAQVGNRTFEGYVPEDSLDGLQEVEQSRQTAASPATSDTLRMMVAQPLAALTKSVADSERRSSVPRVVMAQAQDWIDANQPARALALLEPELKKHREPGILMLAGVAAWKSDDARIALDYWKESLEMEPNPRLQELYAEVERERSHDQSGEKLFGTRVALRFDPKVVPRETARQMVGVVDETYFRVSSTLGCISDEKIVAIVQSRDAYLKTTNAAEWSGGLFDGRIHMPAMVGQQMSAESERILAHETTHACLHMIGTWPSWLHEGLAQKLSGDILPPQIKADLQTMIKAGKMPKLEDLGNGWGGMDSQHAYLAYALALAAADAMVDRFGTDGIRNLMKSPERLPDYTAQLDRILGL